MVRDFSAQPRSDLSAHLKAILYVPDKCQNLSESNSRITQFIVAVFPSRCCAVCLCNRSSQTSINNKQQGIIDNVGTQQARVGLYLL